MQAKVELRVSAWADRFSNRFPEAYHKPQVDCSEMIPEILGEIFPTWNLVKWFSVE